MSTKRPSQEEGDGGGTALDDMPTVQELGQRVHDSVVLLVNDVGHEILTSTEKSRPPVPECADKTQEAMELSNAVIRQSAGISNRC